MKLETRGDDENISLKCIQDASVADLGILEFLFSNIRKEQLMNVWGMFYLAEPKEKYDMKLEDWIH